MTTTVTAAAFDETNVSVDIDNSPKGTATVYLRSDSGFVTARFPFDADKGLSRKDRLELARRAAKEWIGRAQSAL